MVKAGITINSTQCSVYPRHVWRESKDKVFSDISHIAKLLKDNSYLGRIEPLLDEASVAYRSITVNKLNKIIYYVNDDTIEIVDFWDTRMDPLQLSNRVSS